MAGPAGTITINASGSTGIDFETFIRGGFLADATGGGFPVFDNGMAFSGEEMMISYGGAGASDKYVLAHGDITYNFGTHTVSGTINTIEYGTRGSGAFDADGYFVGGNAELVITGLAFANGLTPEAEVEATGAVHNFTVAHMSGSSADPDRLDLYADQLDAYAQVFIGSSGGDLFAATQFDDTVTGGGGNDSLAGGDGADVANYSGNKADYSVVNNGDGTWTVTDNRGPGNDGADTLTGIELAQFADQAVVLADNMAPVAADDVAATGKNIKTTVDVLANDTDSDGTLDPSTVTVVDGPDHGTFSINATTGRITYTPTKDYVGSDSFTYTVKDNDGGVSAEATVSVDVASKLTLTSADEAFVADLVAIGPVEVDGGAGADYLGGSSNPSTAGADSFYGGEGNDVIFGATGNDRLEGGAGDDILRSGSGSDTLIGGAGSDTYGIRFFATSASSTKDNGTATITDDDGVLWNGTIRPDPMPSGWPSGQQPPATAGFEITGTADYVSPGVWDLTQIDDKGLTQHFTINWTGGNLTMAGVSSTATVVIENYVNGAFGITLENDAPTDLVLSANTVAENAAVGTVVGILSATDPEGQPLAYTLTDDADGTFALVTEGGVTKLVVNGALDYEVARSHQISVKVSDGVNDVTETFGIDVTNLDEPGDPAGTITIDASGSNGIDLEAFIRGGFIADATGGGFPVFDNGAAFSGEEMMISYGAAAPETKYVLAHGQIEYFFGTHTVHGTINTIEYGARGSGTFDSNGYFVGGSAQLVITGLEFFNAVSPEAEVEANGPVHNFSVVHMYGAGADPARLATYADALDDYAQIFKGSSGADIYSGTKFGDTITGAGGSDLLVGGDGVDTAIFSSNSADYTITLNADGSFTVDGDDGADTLSAIEKLKFADKTLDAPENQAPTSLALSGTLNLATVTAFVHETKEVGGVIGTLSASDPEGGDLTFSLTGDDAGKFEIVGNELRLKAGLDYETATSHVIEVTAKDEAGNSTTQNFTVQVRDDVEAQEGTLVIDASALGAAGVNFTSFLATYLAGLGTGTATFYGGTADANPFGPPGSITYQNGSQIGFRYGSNTQQVLIDGTDLNYNFIHHGSAYSHGITGDVDQVTFGRYDGATVPSTPADGTNGPGELTNVLQALTISGFALGAAPGAGFSTADNAVYRLYTDLRTGNAADIAELLSHYAQNFKGTSGNDVFIGSKFADTINGNGGLDILIGGAGDDRYVVDSADDIIVETDNGGTDAVMSSVDWTLGASLEDLQLTGGALNGAGNGLNNSIVGTSGNNLLDGKGGSDTLTGGAGDDTYIVNTAGDVVVELNNGGHDTVQSLGFYTLGDNVEDLILLGSASIGGAGNGLANIITGNAGNNLLDGAGGADTLIGGAGHDVYYVDRASDKIIEGLDQGTDAVRSTVRFSLGDNLERLVLLGTDNLAGIGNDLDNAITGNAGNNILDGGSGADTLTGGQGNDVYKVDNSGDLVREAADQGNDGVQSSVDFALGSAVERLTLTGTVAITGAGNKLDNVITGNVSGNVLNGAGGADTIDGGAGADTIYGGAGADRLIGGAEADTFLFKALSDSSPTLGKDMIVGFDADDIIDLSALDAKAGVAGNQAFSFIATSAFSGQAGELRYTTSGAQSVLTADVNGDKIADFAIHFKGAQVFQADDFLL